MQPVLFDTSIYIAALRATNDAALRLKRLAGGASLWMSAVVLEELYAGANGRGRRAVERLEGDFEKAGRVLAPSLGDWTQTGKVLALLGAKYGYEQIGKGRLTNDALIAMSARRLGIAVITANARDFARLAEFQAFVWRVDAV